MKDKKPVPEPEPAADKKPEVSPADYPDQAEYWKAKKEAEASK